MRKVFLGVLTAVITLSFGTINVFAAGPGVGRNYTDIDSDGICDYAGSNCIYVDADDDGICDGCGIYHGCCLNGDGNSFVDADGDGICDNCGMTGTAYCGNFIDADGDGICDNYASGQGYGNGPGRGRNYIDADNDGVCDNYTSDQGPGRGRGNGRGNGCRGGRCR